MQSPARFLVLTNRQLVRSPQFFFISIFTLILGMLAVTLAYAAVHEMIYKPLGYNHESELVVLRHSAEGFDSHKGNATEALYRHYQEYSKSFSSIAAYIENSVSLNDQENEPTQVDVALVTPEIFSTLQIQPTIGRSFSETDVTPETTPVVIISYNLWNGRYGSDPNIVGKWIELNRTRKQIIGVLPAGLKFPKDTTAVWYPFSVSHSQPDDRLAYLNIIARLRPGSQSMIAQTELEQLIASASHLYPNSPMFASGHRLTVNVVPLKDALLGLTKPILNILLGASVCVLMLVWANLANLFMVRSEKKKQEVAIKKALGITQLQLMIDIVAEAFYIALLSGIAVLCLTWLVAKSRLPFLGLAIANTSRVPLTFQICVILGVLVLLTTGLLGAASFWHASRANLAEGLRSSGRRTSARRAVQQILVACQVALSLALLASATALLRDFLHLRSVDTGYEPSNLLITRITLPYDPYPTYQDGARFFNELSLRLMARPGVTHAGAAMVIPLATAPSDLIRSASNSEFSDQASAQRRVFGLLNPATPTYFETSGSPILRGRNFASGDARNPQHPAIITESMAMKLFGSTEAVGKKFAVSQSLQFMVIGVAGNVTGDRLDSPEADVIYLPTIAEPSDLPINPSSMFVLVKSSLPEGAISSMIRSTVHDLDAQVPVAQPVTMDSLIASSRSQIQLLTLSFFTAAAAALVLGLVGIYALLSYIISIRRFEIAIRLALGGAAGDVQRMLLKESVPMIAGGLVAGTLIAFMLGRLSQNAGFNLNLTEPFTLLPLFVLLFLVGMIACYLPARRVYTVNPAEILNSSVN